MRQYPYDHFDPFVGEAPEAIAADQIAFLARQGIVVAPQRATA